MIKKSITFLFLITSLISFATNYYVSNSTGNDLNSGSQVSPWKTLNKVNNSNFTASDSILFRCNDEWSGQLIIPSSGLIGNHIYFGSYSNGNRPIINGNGYSKTVSFDNKEYITFSSIEVTSGNHCIFIESSDYTGLIILNNIDAHLPVTNNCLSIMERANVEVYNSNFYNSVAGNGVSAYVTTSSTNGWASLVCDNIIISDCHIHDNYHNGVFIAGHNAIITDNIIENNGAYGVEPTRHNIYLVGDNAQVIGNYLLSSMGGDGFRYEGSNLIIKNNFIKDNFSHGISLSNDFPNTHLNNSISNNIIRDANDGYGILVFSNTSGIFQNVEIYNNSIFSDSPDFTGLGLYHGAAIVLRNNIIQTNKQTICLSELCATDLSSDYNCFYADVPLHMYNPSNGSLISFSDWQTSGNDASSLDVDPLFYNPTPQTDSDFILSSISSCINAGIDVGLLDDYFGLSILGLPDIGAIESNETSNLYEVESKILLNIYPNPFSFETSLKTDISLKNGTITIVNSTGQTVKQINNITGQEITLYRNNLPNGLYFFRLTEENKTSSIYKLLIIDN
jgi:hypothetical protein